MTGRVFTNVSFHDFPAAVGYWRVGTGSRWLDVEGDGGSVTLWGDSHADVAATLVRLAGEAMGHLDAEGRAVVLAAVHRAFTPAEALDPRQLAEVTE